MAKVLSKPLPKDLVHAALSNLNVRSSPGFTGILCAVYAAFAGAFVPVMFDIISNLYASGTISNLWSLALVIVITTNGDIAGMEAKTPATNGLLCASRYTHPI